MFQHELQTDKDKDPSFFKEKTCTPDNSATWKGPGGGASSFYTTWSFYAIIAATCFAVLMGIVFAFSPKLARTEWFSTLCLAIMIGFAVNSLAVAVTSQFLLNFNWKPLNPDPTARTAADEKWIKKLNNINATVHLLPIILALVILTITIRMRWKGNKTILYFVALSVPIIYFTIWLCIPVPKSKESNEMTNFTNKVAYVYNYPSTWIMGLMPIAAALCTFMFVLAKNNNSMSLKK